MIHCCAPPLVWSPKPLVPPNDDRQQQQEQSKAMSWALVLAAMVGLLQMIVYVCWDNAFCPVSVSMPRIQMYHLAMTYWNVRAYGAPAAMIWLVTNGIFVDWPILAHPSIIPPLVYPVECEFLDPWFIFTCHWGVAGAVAGTTVAQYAAVIPLLYALHKKVPLFSASSSSSLFCWNDIMDLVQQYVTAGTQV
jgi:Na+-driven multidrug efflux pump